MPNHCGNKLIITGLPEDRQRFFNTVHTDQEDNQTDLDLDKIVPSDGFPNSSWGTKWGCYQTSVKHFDNRDEITFLTAWCPYRPSVQQEMSKLFPTLLFELLYAERGCEVYGFYRSHWNNVSKKVIFSQFQGTLCPTQDCDVHNDDCLTDCEVHCCEDCEEHEPYLTGPEAKYQDLYEMSG